MFSLALGDRWAGIILISLKTIIFQLNTIYYNISSNEIMGFIPSAARGRQIFLGLNSQFSKSIIKRT